MLIRYEREQFDRADDDWFTRECVQRIQELNEYLTKIKESEHKETTIEIVNDMEWTIRCLERDFDNLLDNYQKVIDTYNDTMDFLEDENEMMIAFIEEDD